MGAKRCYQCGEEKPLKEFYKQSLSKDGHASECKRCRKFRNAYTGMMSRCYRPKDDSYLYYGAKGIRVCEEWHDFNNFSQWLLDNNWEPGMSVERKDIRLNYCPDNCTLIHKRLQQRNKRNTKLSLDIARGIRLMRSQGVTLKRIAMRFGVSESSVSNVIYIKCWLPEEELLARKSYKEA